ncbi:MAG TPA: hypothetical protein VNF04_09085 [Stellaceae bacterium]|nr:hypothetical protein [Stellaceae bacterium]
MPVEEIAEGMRECPFCAEIIRSKAKICRFCQRDLPIEPTEESVTPAAEPEPPELGPPQYGDRVSSPTRGGGVVVGSRPDRDWVFVEFDRDHIQRRVAVSDLQILHRPLPHAPPTAHPGATRATPPRSNSDENLVVAAWISAFVLPLIGFVCGVILVAKGQVGHGVGSMIASFLMSFIWVAILGGLVR